MKKNMFLMMLCVLIILGCATTSVPKTPVYQVKHEIYDNIDNPFTVDTVVLQVINKGREEIYLNKINSKNKYFTIKVYFTGNNWRFMDGNFMFEADGKIYKYTGLKPTRKVLSDGKVSEIITAIIPDKDMIELSVANKIRIQYYAEPINFDENAINFLKQFYSEYK